MHAPGSTHVQFQQSIRQLLQPQSGSIASHTIMSQNNSTISLLTFVSPVYTADGIAEVSNFTQFALKLAAATATAANATVSQHLMRRRRSY